MPPVYLKDNEIVGVPPAGEHALWVDANGAVWLISPSGSKTPVGGAAGAVNWQQAMFALAAAKYPTLATDFLVDFTKGTGGDYVAVVASGNGATTINSSLNGGVVQLSAGGSASAGQIGVVGIGHPVIAAKAKTGAPWFYAARAKLGSTPGAGSKVQLGPTSATSEGQAEPFIGVDGPTSTAFIVTCDGSVKTATTIPIPAPGASFDVAVGFDGVTVTYWFGDLLRGTLAVAGTTTNLANITDAALGPWVVINESSTTVQLVTSVDKIYMAVANF